MTVAARTPTPSPRPRAAVALVRASTDRQEASTADQREQIARWAATSQHELVATFEDDGISGSRLDRPGLLGLLAYVEKNPTGGVVVAWRRNRLARPDDPRDGLALERRIEKAGWRLHYLHGAQTTGNALVDTLTATIEHHEAGSFLRTIALDTTRGAAKAVRQHARWRGPTPYGYAKSVVWPGGTTQVLPRTSPLCTPDASVHLVPGEPAEVETVRYAFERYGTGVVGVESLCVELTERGSPSPGGGPWRLGTLREILRSPVYVGHVTWNRRSGGKFAAFQRGEAVRRPADATRHRRNAPSEWVVARDCHEPLVTPEQWERVQAVLKARATENGGRRRAVRFPLSGLMRCAACGGPFCVHTSTRRGRRYQKYICSGTDPGRACRWFALHPKVVEAAVLTRIAEALRPYRGSARLRETILRELAPDGAGGPDLRSLDRQLAELESKTKRAVLNMGEVTPDVARLIGDQIAQWTARADEIRALRATAAAQVKEQDPEARADQALALLADLERLTPEAPEADRRRFYEGVIEQVVLTFETRQVGRRQRHVPTGGRLVLRGPLGELGTRLAGVAGVYFEPARAPPGPASSGYAPYGHADHSGRRPRRMPITYLSHVTLSSQT